MLNTLIKAVRAAQPIVLSNFRKKITFTYKKNHQDLLSIVDEKSQKKIKSVILEELKIKGIDRKNVGFIGEENLYEKGDHLFIIDPIDGTTNYVSDIGYFGICIAHLYKGETQNAVILNPVENKLYYATKDRGAFVKSGKEEKQLKILDQKLENSLVCTYFSSNLRLSEEMFEAQKKLFPQARGLRSHGSSSIDSINLCENQFGVIIYNTSWIWDIAMTKLIIEEAGGVVTNWNGESVKFDLSDTKKRYPSISCHPNLLQKIIEVINI